MSDFNNCDKNISVNISLEQYKQRIVNKIRNITEEEVSVPVEKSLPIVKERQALEASLQYSDISYNEYIIQLNRQVQRLKKYCNIFPSSILDEIINALVSDNNFKAIELIKELYSSWTEKTNVAAELQYQLGVIAQRNIDYRLAQKHFVKAVKLLPDNLDYFYSEGWIMRHLCDYDRAIICFKKALAIYQKTAREDRVCLARIFNNLGEAWYQKDNYLYATKYHKKALVIWMEIEEGDYFNLAMSYYSLGLIWLSQGAYDKAIDYYETALPIIRKKLGEDHSGVATIYGHLGAAWSLKGDCNKAIKYYEKALKIDRNKLGEDHSNVAMWRDNIRIARKEKRK